MATRVSASVPATLVLAYLGEGEIYTEIAAGYSICTTSAIVPGKHKWRGGNVQVVLRYRGRLVGPHPRGPGARYHMGAARDCGIIKALHEAQIKVIEKRGYTKIRVRGIATPEPRYSPWAGERGALSRIQKA